MSSSSSLSSSLSSSSSSSASSSSPFIRSLSSNAVDISLARDTLVSAFDRNPLSHWLYPDATERTQAHTAMFQTECTEHVAHVIRDDSSHSDTDSDKDVNNDVLRNCYADVVNDFSGVALWKHVSSSSNSSAHDDNLRDSIGSESAVANSSSDISMIISDDRRRREFFEVVYRAAPPSPYWYLSFLGAKVEKNGAGTALLRYRLQKLQNMTEKNQTTNVPSAMTTTTMTTNTCALWTTENNVSYYKKIGFDTLEGGSISYRGATATWMVKKM